MIVIARREIDVRPIIGAVVVFSIIATVGWVGAEVLIFGPARQRLEDAKTDALGYLDGTLGSIATSQADTATASYRAQIQDAGSTDDVAMIRSEVTSTYNREAKRADLLAEVERATVGTFYSFPDLESSLRNEINSKMTLSELESYEQSGTIGTRATSEWENLHDNVIENISENRIVMRRHDSHGYVEYKSKSEAKDYVDANSWQVLRELRFENAGSYEVPIADIFQRAPTVKPGSTVDVYVYDYATENLSLEVGGTTVRSVIYPEEELGVIAWTLIDGATTYTYSIDIWEALKAATAGDTEAASVITQDYAEHLIESALSAGVGDFDLQAIYVVEVPSQSDAQKLTNYEQYSTKDLILVARVS